MALIVETGSGSASADAYDSLANVDSYFTDRPTHSLFSTWDAATDANKESAIRQATEYLDTKYRWRGIRATSIQSLEWPREGVYNSRGLELTGQVPAKVKKAVAEMAARALSETLTADKDRSGYTKSEKVDVIEVEYSANAPTQKVYAYVDDLVREYVTSSLTNDLVRA